jgi:hypothetical protein
MSRIVMFEVESHPVDGSLADHAKWFENNMDPCSMIIPGSVRVYETKAQLSLSNWFRVRAGLKALQQGGKRVKNERRRHTSTNHG